jgi:hypothetical protein
VARAIAIPRCRPGLQARLHGPNAASGPWLLHLYSHLIVLDIDGQSQDVLVRPAVTMMDGIRDELRDGETRITHPPIQRSRDPSIQCRSARAGRCSSADRMISCRMSVPAMLGT